MVKWSKLSCKIHLVFIIFFHHLESEKPYLLKLKTSEQKRQRRKLDYSKSDPLAKRSRPRLRHFSSTTSMGKISDSEDNCIMQPMSAGKFNIRFSFDGRPLVNKMSLQVTLICSRKSMYGFSDQS